MKWRKKDYDTLRKQVNNYNNKIRRELKKGVSENLLPVKLSYKELKNTIAQLISAEEMASLYNLKAEIERKENRIKRRENKEKYNGRW